MVSASHAKGAAEIAARGISVTKEIAYATVLGLAGGSVFKARTSRALAARVTRCLPRRPARAAVRSAVVWRGPAAACGGAHAVGSC